MSSTNFHKWFVLDSMKKNKMDISENDISKMVYEAGCRVHKTLGPGLLESAYEECLFYELNERDIFCWKTKTYAIDIWWG